MSRQTIPLEAICMSIDQAANAIHTIDLVWMVFTIRVEKFAQRIAVHDGHSTRRPGEMLTCRNSALPAGCGRTPDRAMRMGTGVGSAAAC